MQSGRSDTMPGGDSRAALLAVALVVAVGAAAALALALSGAAAADDAVAEGQVSLHGDAATSSTSWSYDVEDLESVEDFSVELTGQKVTEARSKSATTESETLDIDPRGTSDPENAVMRLTGERTEESQSRTETTASGFSIDVAGNNSPESESITIEGDGSTTSQSSSYFNTESESDTITVGGTTSPSSESVTIEPQSFEGDQLWSESLDSSVDAVAVANGQVYAGTWEETLYAFDESGNQQWSESLDSSVNAVAVANGQVYAVTNGDTLYAFDESGNQQWTESVDDVARGVAVANGQVYAGTNGDTLYAFDESGNQQWTESLDSSVNAVAVANGQVYAGMNGETLYALSDGVSDPSVSVGSNTVSVSGSLDSTYSESISLSTGTESVDISSDGAVDVDIEWTEDHRVQDPSATVDGSTVSHSGPLGSGETASGSVAISDPGSQSVDVATNGGSPTVTVEWTEITTPQNPSIELDGGEETLAHAGELSDGQTVEEPISLSTGEHSAAVSSNGPVMAEVLWTEVSKSDNPTITVNGEEVGHTGTLSEGQTSSLEVSEGWIQEGENTVEVDLADGNGGPEPQVGVSYQHTAQTTISTNRTASTWEVEVDSSREFATEQHDVVLSYPMPEHVVEVDQVVIDGETAASEDYQLDGTDLEVSVGSVEAQEQIDVFARGSKVRVKDGDIDVVDPTSEGDVLDSTIEVTEASEDLRVDVGETVRSERLHRASETSWGERLPVRVESDGSQTLLLGASGATEGSSATITESEWSLEAESGDIVATALAGEMPERGAEVNGSLPRVDIDSGEIGGSQATLTRHDAQTGESYQLVDVIDDRVVERSTAGSPVSFDIVDEPAEYRIELAPESGDIIGVGGAGDDGGDGLLPPWLLLILGVSASVSFLGLGSERGYLPRSALVIGSGGVVVLGLELVSPVSLLAELRWSATSATNRIIAMLADTGIAIVLGASAVVLAVWWFDGRTSRSIPLPIYLGIGGLAAFSVVESIAPGAITDGRLPGMQEVGPLIWILLIGGSIALVWRSIGSDEPTIEISTED